MDLTIFDLFAQLPIVQKLGITAAWMNAAATNVFMLLGMVKPKFPQIDNWVEESLVVALLTTGLAGAQFYANPWAIPVAVLLVWFAATFVTKTGASGVSAAHDTIKKEKP